MLTVKKACMRSALTLFKVRLFMTRVRGMTSSCFEAREKKDEEEEEPDEDVDEDRDVNFPNQEWSGGLKYSV